MNPDFLLIFQYSIDIYVIEIFGQKKTCNKAGR